MLDSGNAFSSNVLLNITTDMSFQVYFWRTAKGLYKGTLREATLNQMTSNEIFFNVWFSIDTSSINYLSGNSFLYLSRQVLYKSGQIT